MERLKRFNRFMRRIATRKERGNKDNLAEPQEVVPQLKKRKSVGDLFRAAASTHAPRDGQFTSTPGVTQRPILPSLGFEQLNGAIGWTEDFSRPKSFLKDWPAAPSDFTFGADQTDIKPEIEVDMRQPQSENTIRVISQVPVPEDCWASKINKWSSNWPTIIEGGSKPSILHPDIQTEFRQSRQSQIQERMPSETGALAFVETDHQLLANPASIELPKRLLGRPSHDSGAGMINNLNQIETPVESIMDRFSEVLNLADGESPLHTREQSIHDHTGYSTSAEMYLQQDHFSQRLSNVRSKSMQRGSHARLSALDTHDRIGNISEYQHTSTMCRTNSHGLVGDARRTSHNEESNFITQGDLTGPNFDTVVVRRSTPAYRIWTAPDTLRPQLPHGDSNKCQLDDVSPTPSASISDSRYLLGKRRRSSHGQHASIIDYFRAHTYGEQASAADATQDDLEDQHCSLPHTPQALPWSVKCLADSRLLSHRSTGSVRSVDTLPVTLETRSRPYNAGRSFPTRRCKSVTNSFGLNRSIDTAVNNLKISNALIKVSNELEDRHIRGQVQSQVQRPILAKLRAHSQLYARHPSTWLTSLASSCKWVDSQAAPAESRHTDEDDRDSDEDEYFSACESTSLLNTTPSAKPTPNPNPFAYGFTRSKSAGQSAQAHTLRSQIRCHADLRSSLQYTPSQPYYGTMAPNIVRRRYCISQHNMPTLLDDDEELLQKNEALLPPSATPLGDLSYEIPVSNTSTYSEDQAFKAPNTDGNNVAYNHRRTHLMADRASTHIRRVESLCHPLTKPVLQQYAFPVRHSSLRSSDRYNRNYVAVPVDTPVAVEHRQPRTLYEQNPRRPPVMSRYWHVPAALPSRSTDPPLAVHARCMSGPHQSPYSPNRPVSAHNLPRTMPADSRDVYNTSRVHAIRPAAPSTTHASQSAEEQNVH